MLPRSKNLFGAFSDILVFWPISKLNIFIGNRGPNIYGEASGRNNIIISTNVSLTVFLATIVHENVHIENNFIIDAIVKIMEHFGGGGSANTGKAEDKIYDLINKLEKDRKTIECCHQITGKKIKYSYTKFDQIVAKCENKTLCQSLGGNK